MHRNGLVCPLYIPWLSRLLMVCSPSPEKEYYIWVTGLMGFVFLRKGNAPMADGFIRNNIRHVTPKYVPSECTVKSINFFVQWVSRIVPGSIHVWLLCSLCSECLEQYLGRVLNVHVERSCNGNHWRRDSMVFANSSLFVSCSVSG